jgi:septum formation protein
MDKIPIPLVLASASPRRRQLLTLLDIPFTTASADVDERPQDNENPQAIVRRLSQAKAQAVAQTHKPALIIAADTIVVLAGCILGKPADADQALTILKRLRGRAHTVYSGLVVLDSRSGHMVRELAETTVWMRSYRDAEIERYVASGDPLDKAGAYAIQHAQFTPVARVQGCYASVMGLPLCHLYRGLLKMGLSLPHTPIQTCQSFTGHRCTVGKAIVQET